MRTLALPVELEHDVVFDLKVVDKAALSGIRGHTPFMERVLAEGVEVCMIRKRTLTLSVVSTEPENRWRKLAFWLRIDTCMYSCTSL